MYFYSVCSGFRLTSRAIGADGPFQDSKVYRCIHRSPELSLLRIITILLITMTQNIIDCLVNLKLFYWITLVFSFFLSFFYSFIEVPYIFINLRYATYFDINMYYEVIIILKPLNKLLNKF